MSKFFTTLCHPAKRLMARFRYSVKFTLISMIFIIPLVLSLALLQYEYGEEIRFKSLSSAVVVTTLEQDLNQGFLQLNILSQSVADYSNLELDLELATMFNFFN